MALTGSACAVCMCFTWGCKPGGGITGHFVCVSRGGVSLGDTTVHFVCLLRGGVSLGKVPLCTFYVFYVVV